MASRALLHKDKVPAFLDYCRGLGMTVRDGRGTWQIAQIQPKGSTDTWHVLYSRMHMPEHVTVPEGLIRVVLQWLRESKSTPNP